MNRIRASLSLLCCALLLAGCQLGFGGSNATGDGGTARDGGVADGGVGRDGGALADGGALSDGGSPSDGGHPTDGGSPSDGGNAADGGCHAMSECPNTQQCVGPGDTQCGICRRPSPTCLDDSACGQGEICEPIPASECGCDPSMKGCRPGCSDALPCGAAFDCVDLRCVPKACGASTECPALYDCVGADNAGLGECRRRGCSGASDATCGSGGYCVNGLCQPSLGVCRPPAA